MEIRRSKDTGHLEEALDSLDAGSLRRIFRDLFSLLEEPHYSMAAEMVLDRAARKGSGWKPRGPSGEEVEEILSLVEEMRDAGWAEGEEVDPLLRKGSLAFLARDYGAAREIFGALLPPIGTGMIAVGEQGDFDENLHADTFRCIGQFLVSVYHTASPKKRAMAVRCALEEVKGVHCFMNPLREMEETALEKLPGFRGFLRDWRALLEEEQKDAGPGGRRSSTERHWLWEVVLRLEGPAGLGRLARNSGDLEDFDQWCRILFRKRDWKGALVACEETLEIVPPGEWKRRDFLDGAALAARELGLPDFLQRMERAWREFPDFARLVRWMGALGEIGLIRKEAGRVLDLCPRDGERQKAFLRVLTGDLEGAAEILARAPGLGWSGGEHPGRLLFPFFYRLLGGVTCLRREGGDFFFPLLPDWGFSTWIEEELSSLPGPDPWGIMKRAVEGAVLEEKTRRVLVEALRKSAEKRVEGVTGKTRRRHYGHAASLVAACREVDPSPRRAARWVDEFRVNYRRYPAFQGELEDRLDPEGEEDL